jgi:hypothetical protein
MPGGFPLWHARFWANRVIPAIVIVVAVAGVAGAEKRKRWLYQAATMFFPLMWTASLVAAAVLFPVSGRRFLLPATVGVIVLWGLGIVACRRQGTWQWSLVPVVLSSLMIGVGLPWTQWADDADIRRSKVKQLLYGAPGAGEAGDKAVRGTGEDAEIRPLTDAEFQELQAKLKAENAAKERLPEGAPKTYQAAPRLIDDHYMSHHLNNIRTLLGIDATRTIQ